MEAVHCFGLLEVSWSSESEVVSVVYLSWFPLRVFLYCYSMTTLIVLVSVRYFCSVLFWFSCQYLPSVWLERLLR